ncbi:MAG TPA: ABC transporter substrate-binding protein, partial [Pseudothermotoga sp.]
MKKIFTILMITVLTFLAVSYPLTIFDDAARVVTITKEPQRIVSVAPLATKYLQYLGVESKVVGVTDWDDFEAEKIGNMVPLNVEKILSLKPDIVFASGDFQFPEVAKLEEQKITTVVLNPNTIEQILT